MMAGANCKNPSASFSNTSNKLSMPIFLGTLMMKGEEEGDELQRQREGCLCLTLETTKEYFSSAI
jgi:hypothetical protein